MENATGPETNPARSTSGIAQTPVTWPRQILHFIIHLRWHYQLLILPGCYLLGGLFFHGLHCSDGDQGLAANLATDTAGGLSVMLMRMVTGYGQYLSGLDNPGLYPALLSAFTHPLAAAASNFNTSAFVIQFLNIHLLLFGGATAYNSYWDKDTGRVGGLKNPPPIRRWMHPASLSLQAVGLVIALTAGWLFVVLYGTGIMLFWLYSTPHARWKGHPLLSLAAIGGSTGLVPFLCGYLAAGGAFSWWLLVPAAGCSLILLSMYPVSQIFQIDEDRRRGYETFTIRYGLSGVRTFFLITYSAGLVITGLSLLETRYLTGILFLILSVITGTFIRSRLNRITSDPNEYEGVMRLKYSTSFAFVIFIITAWAFF